jgi:hypothetical protein
VYEDQLKLKGESEAKEKDQPCEWGRVNKVSQEKRLDLAKIGINK